MAATARKPTPPKNAVSARPYAPKDTPEAREKFLDGLRAGKTVKDAAAGAGVPRRTVVEWRLKDSDFKEQWEQAYDEGTDVLEAEAQRRAVEGCDEPIYQQGELVGHKRVYSDTLMNLMLQGRRPHKYRRSQVELTGPDGGPLQATLAVEFVKPGDKAK